MISSLHLSNFLVLVLICYIVIMNVLVCQKEDSPRLRHSLVAPKKHDKSLKQDVVFLVKTHAGQFDMDKPINIITTIQSFIEQENQNWVAFLINTDIDPLPLTKHPLTDIMLVDSRIRIITLGSTNKYNEWVNGYDLIDRALDELIHINIPWIVFTSGTNYYHPKFLNYIPYIGQVDIVMSDYYSNTIKHDNKQYDSNTNEITPLTMSDNICYKSTFYPNNIPLGGLIISLIKLQKEKHRFIEFGEIHLQENFLYIQLRNLHWTIMKTSQCYYSEGINPYICNKKDNIWWDSSTTLNELINESCYNKNTAKIILQTSIPTPDLLISKTNIKYYQIPIIYHIERLLLIQQEQDIFESNYKQKIYDFRNHLCNNLHNLKTYKFDVISYKKLNIDLLQPGSGLINDIDFINHFWLHGCIEMRSIAQPPLEYYALKSNTEIQHLY